MICIKFTKNAIISNDLRYIGFINTPNLWEYKLYSLEQFKLSNQLFSIPKNKKFKEIRLGKRVEEFFDFQIRNMSKISAVAQNVQIKNQKITIGELDVILLDNNKPCHIEIVYKFYLYKPDIGGDYISKWVGPNLKDTLKYKLSKIREKQLSLLYSEQSNLVLKTLGLKAENISQKVCYRAQLFLPYQQEADIKPLNKDCIYGYYFNIDQIDQFSDCKFYFPRKLDWLIDLHEDVKWESFKAAKPKVEEFIDAQRSPMVWLKDENGQLTKCFVTF